MSKRRRRKTGKVIGIFFLVLMIVIAGGMVAKKVLFKEKATCSPQQHLNIVTEVQPEVKLVQDICYKQSNQNKCYMDIAFPAEKSPLIVMVHGGSWVRGSKEEMKNVQLSLAAAGYTVANVDYDMLRLEDYFNGELESMLSIEESIERAISYLVQHAGEYNIDPDNIVLVGGSSSGQTCGNLAERIARKEKDYGYDLKGLILASGATDLRYLIYNEGGSEDAMGVDVILMPFVFTGEYDSDPITEIKKIDVRENLTELLPPILLIHGNQDDRIPQRVSENLYEDLLDMGVSAELLIAKGVGHAIPDQVFGDAIYTFMKTYID